MNNGMARTRKERNFRSIKKCMTVAGGKKDAASANMLKCSDVDRHLGKNLFLAACSLHCITPTHLDVPYDLPQALFSLHAARPFCPRTTSARYTGIAVRFFSLQLHVPLSLTHPVTSVLGIAVAGNHPRCLKHPVHRGETGH